MKITFKNAKIFNIRESTLISLILGKDKVELVVFSEYNQVVHNVTDNVIIEDYDGRDRISFHMYHQNLVSKEEPLVLEIEGENIIASQDNYKIILDVDNLNITLFDDRDLEYLEGSDIRKLLTFLSLKSKIKNLTKLLQINIPDIVVLKGKMSLSLSNIILKTNTPIKGDFNVNLNTSNLPKSISKIGYNKAYLVVFLEGSKYIYPLQIFSDSKESESIELKLGDEYKFIKAKEYLKLLDIAEYGDVTVSFCSDGNIYSKLYLASGGWVQSASEPYGVQVVKSYTVEINLFKTLLSLINQVPHKYDLTSPYRIGLKTNEIDIIISGRG